MKITCDMGRFPERDSNGVVTEKMAHGNRCLHIFRAFKYAMLNGIDFNNIMIDNRYFQPLFGNFHKNFHQQNEISKYNFNININDITKTHQIFPDDNIIFSGCEWTYPDTAEEFQLFGELFDNNAIRQRVLSKYKHYYSKTTIGMCIRRGDFLNYSRSFFRVLTKDQLNGIINTVRNLWRTNYTIILMSDDMKWVEENVDDSTNCIFHQQTTPEDDLFVLSLCDEIINNGVFTRCYENVDGTHESTFGQVAQIIQMSRKYKNMNLYNI